MVPPGTDVRTLDGFMLNVERLLASELWALSTGEELKAALGLWCRAWKQVPAGSLPNDERVLASFSGAASRWPKVRAMALHGFVKCSDGRLYHPVLCEDVRRAADRQRQYRDKREADRERLAKWRKDRKLSEGDWAALRASVFERDGHRCVKCGSDEDLHCDHITEARGGGKSEMHNLTTLCRGCHGRKTALHRNGEMPTEVPNEMHFVGRNTGRDRDGTLGSKVIPVPNGTGGGAPHVDPQKGVFDLGKRVLGKSSGGQIAKLLKHVGGNCDRAAELLTLASGKGDAGEYIAGILRGNGDDVVAETDRLYREWGVQ